VARYCDTVRGGIRCGRTAKVKVGLAVGPHRPGQFWFYCQEHGDLWMRSVQPVLDDDVRAEVVRLDGVSSPGH
jgi:hypothetical protein